eukprot:4819855-Prorocentrum_lima.AAC.1
MRQLTRSSGVNESSQPGLNEGAGGGEPIKFLLHPLLHLLRQACHTGIALHPLGDPARLDIGSSE